MARATPSPEPPPSLSWLVVAQRYRAGCWGIGERRQLWSARQSAQVVVIYLTGGPFHRVVVDVDEPERAHRQIDAALLHSKKTSARRSLRNHEPSITNHPALDPACAEQRPQRQRVPSQDLASIPPHAARRGEGAGEQPHSAAARAASAGAPATGGEGPSGARARSREPVSHLGGPAGHGRTHGRHATHDDNVRATELSPPNEIDPSVAARLRLYEHHARQSARHSHPVPTSTRLGPNSSQ